MFKKKEKPIEKRTIQEVVNECKEHPLSCSGCKYFNKLVVAPCAFTGLPYQWELNEKIEQTTIVKQKVKGNYNNVTAYVAKEEKNG